MSKAETRRARFVREIKNRNPLDRHAWEHTDLVYEYRGREYIVTRHNNGYAFDTLKNQHKAEQARIDYEIEHENDGPKPYKYEGSAQEGFDLFFEYVNGE